MITEEDFKLNVVSDMSGGVYGGDEASTFTYLSLVIRMIIEYLCEPSFKT